MGELNEKRFLAGLNSDDEDRALQQGEYRYALNIRNGSSDNDNMGAVENVRGNVLVEFDLPDGDNICIGTHFDKENVTVFYFIWNSNGNHRIQRFYPEKGEIELVLEAESLNFDKNHLVTHANLIDEDKLYWTDNFNPPRKININKANDTDKFRKFNLHFNLGAEELWATQGVDYNLRLGAPDGVNTVFDTEITVIQGLTYEEAAKEIAKCINQTTPFRNSITAEACGKHVECTMKFKGDYEPVFYSSLDTAIAVPQNYYVKPMVAEIMERIKAPAKCEPKLTLEEDPSRSVNYLLKKLFQFRVRYYFDDFEKSVLGPISCLSIDESSCDAQISSSPLNCIRVDFTEDKLNDINFLSIIKKVELFVREGNDGVWKSVDVIEQDCFGVGQNYFKFYNDNSYSVIDDATANKPSDAVPLLSATQEFVKNRLYDGNTLEGYDPTCIDAEIDVSYEDAPDTETYSITGRIIIVNPFVDNGNYVQYQAIHDLQDGNGTVWGGFGPFNVVNQVGTSYKQTLPLDGFTVYLAGTDYYAVSRQVAPNINNAVYLQNNVMNSDNGQGKRGAVREGIKDDKLYSTFSINNVPPGRYIIRVASHLTTEADLNDPSKAYQRTSTNAYDFAGSITTELEIVVTSSNVNVGDIKIADLTDPVFQSEVLVGYVTDDDIPDSTWANPSQPTEAELMADTRIERARVDFNTLDGRTPPWLIFGNKKYRYTDHNGYFFFASSPIALQGTKVSDDPGETRCMQYSLQQTNYNTDGTPFDKALQGETTCIIVRSKSTNVSNYGRTVLLGSITDAGGSGVKDILAVNRFGDTQLSDVNGEFQLITYGDTLHYDDAGVSATNSRRVIYTPGQAGCVFEFAPDFEDYYLPLSASNPYNYTQEFNLQPITANLLIGAVNNGFKRGWDGEFGLIYYDFASRSNAANTSEKTKVHINFYTEPDENGNLYPTGKPVLTWKINHIPPSWATHYQWVRTRNEALNDYLQFVADSIEYIDDFNNTATFNNATKIIIDIGNIGDYKTKFPNSQVGIIPDDEYRVRFIKNQSGNIYQEYIDMEIIEATSSTITIYQNFDLGQIGEGTLFEIYRPKRVSEEKLFYEFGECFLIEDGFHKGGLTDQCVWRFTDNFFSGGFVGFISNEPHCLNVGDVITVSQNKGFTNSSYEGECVVTTVVDEYTIITDKSFGTATGAEPGTISVPASGIFTKGDAYYRLRFMPTANGSRQELIDDASVSDFFQSRYSCIGRVAVENTDQGQIRRDTLVRFSSKIFPETKINGLSTFDALDSKPLPQENGPIYKLQLAENVLVAIHQLRWTTIYIEERLITSPDGTEQLSVSNEVIGATRTLRGKWGTVNPESVAEYEGNIWCWDLNKGEVIRYSNNGLQPISDYKMSNYFADKSKTYLNLPKIDALKAYGIYAPFFDEYILSFADVKESDIEVITDDIEEYQGQEDPRIPPEVPGDGDVGGDVVQFKPSRKTPGRVVEPSKGRRGAVAKSEIECIYGEDITKSIEFDTTYLVPYTIPGSINPATTTQIQANGNDVIDVTALNPNSSVFVSPNGSATLPGQEPKFTDTQLIICAGQNSQPFKVLHQFGDCEIQEIALLYPGQCVMITREEGDVTTCGDIWKATPLELCGETRPEEAVIVEGETIAFSERLTRWTTFYSFKPEFYSRTAQDIVSFKEGELWRHNRGDDDSYNNFYGEQFTARIRSVVNDFPSKVKVFRAISIEADFAWSVREIVIPPNEKYPQGMVSRVKKGKFKNKEGIFYSEFLKDLNTPNATSQIEALINGRDLRGKVAEIELENEDTHLVVLFAYNVLHSASEMSKAATP
jgi:hypothetical protein